MCYPYQDTESAGLDTGSWFLSRQLSLSFPQNFWRDHNYFWQIWLLWPYSWWGLNFFGRLTNESTRLRIVVGSRMEIVYFLLCEVNLIFLPNVCILGQKLSFLVWGFIISYLMVNRVILVSEQFNKNMDTQIWHDIFSKNYEDQENHI